MKSQAITFSMTLLSLGFLFFCGGCKEKMKQVQSEASAAHKYPSDVIPFMDKWKILCGDGTRSEDLVNFEKKDFFYVENDGKTDWVVYKTPNSGVTSRTSSNTRTELGQKAHWIPETGVN